MKYRNTGNGIISTFVKLSFLSMSGKPGFYMIVRIVPVVSKNFEAIGKTETIADFHMIVSIASNTEDARSSAMLLGPTTEFWRDIRKRNGRHQSQSESPGSPLSSSLLELIFSHLSSGSWSHIRAKTLTSVKEFIITGCQEWGEQLKMRLGYWYW